MGDPAKTLVIDCHAQLGEGETWEEPKRPVNYTVEMVLEGAAAAGVDRSCVTAPQNPSYEQANRQVARLAEKYPDKIIGFAVHNPQTETGRLKAMLTEEVKSMGLKGLKTDGHPTREILDVVVELEIPVIYYPGPDAEVVRMYHLMADTYPSVKFILPHLGSYRSDRWWEQMAAIDMAKRHPNIYLEASGLCHFGVQSFFEMAAREVPAEQIVFGSYAPESDPRVEIYAVKLLKLPGPQEAKVLGGNISRLLG